MWPVKVSLHFENEKFDKAEKTAYTASAIEGTSPKDFEHFLAKSTVATPPIVHNETAEPILPQAVPLRKKLLVSTTTADAPKTPGLTDCDDLLRPVQK